MFRTDCFTDVAQQVVTKAHVPTKGNGLWKGDRLARNRVKDKAASFDSDLSLCWHKMLIRLYFKILIPHSFILNIVLDGTPAARLEIVIFYTYISWRHKICLRQIKYIWGPVMFILNISVGFHTGQSFIQWLWYDPLMTSSLMTSWQQYQVAQVSWSLPKRILKVKVLNLWITSKVP